MKLIDALGLDWRILAFQLANFVILIFILKKMAYKPILKFIEERTKTIEEGITDAKEAKQLLVDAEKKQSVLLAEARTESQSIITTAREQAQKQAESLVDQSKTEAQRVLDKAKVDIRAEQKQMLEEAKTEISELVLLVTEKITRQKMDESADKEFVSQLVGEMKS